jgi:hypothetical protein
VSFESTLETLLGFDIHSAIENLFNRHPVPIRLIAGQPHLENHTWWPSRLYKQDSPEQPAVLCADLLNDLADIGKMGLYPVH